MRKCRIGTAKFFTLLLLLYHTSIKKQEIYTGECPGTSLMQNIMNPGDFF
ncbi:hypothetical protein GT982_02180 [Bifidobacterium pseudocatenulatum]|nr:hypothetical protein [Bifidobacterium pseudocatenulatum]MZM00844.1 hypothetical protein [Bifidobacterium pseudocatenulatum]MZM19914.1 hypothetical protein [Bifidobacterium pseudocatenulatum]MZM23791.1 hypothetical protein [Bifidobacterium pseudocatenulatum]MZT82773.1 hypothetical protein [Bifidobacterium pseudocatenulatum]